MCGGGWGRSAHLGGAWAGSKVGKAVERVDEERLVEGRSEPVPGNRFTDDDIQDMLVLAGRLRERVGGELDDDAILAVAEATGAPVDYVRLAVRSLPEKRRRRRGVVEQLRSSFLAFEPETRRVVMAMVLGLGAGFFWTVGWAGPLKDSGLAPILSAVFFLGALWNAVVGRSMRTAVLSGAVAGGVSQLSLAFFGAVGRLIGGPLVGASSGAWEFLGSMALGGLLGGVGYGLFDRHRRRLGFADPAEERRQLLHELMSIQEKLKADERKVTFLSVDMVGSTRLKSENDALAVEFTFNEYHRYVEGVVVRNGGKVHSTAGDGVTAVFEDAGGAVRAAKAIQSGLFEFNAFRNQLEGDLVLRAGVHTGTVLAPGKDSTQVEFAHVIDVAAHMQKEAPAGGVVVSGDTALEVGGLAAIGEERVTVDGIAAAVWRSRSWSVPVVPGGLEPGAR